MNCNIADAVETFQNLLEDVMGRGRDVFSFSHSYKLSVLNGLNTFAPLGLTQPPIQGVQVALCLG
jgi:hypothetical protein